MSIDTYSTEELEKELKRRQDMVRHAEIQKREDIGAVLRRACEEIEGFQALLIPSPKSELHCAVFGGSSYDYEITLNSHYNPLREDNR